MTKHAQQYIENAVMMAEANKINDYENITVRIAPKEWAMLKTLSNHYNLKISSTFTEIISKNLCDMVNSLSEEDMTKFKTKFKSRFGDDQIMKNRVLVNALDYIYKDETIGFDIDFLSK